MPKVKKIGILSLARLQAFIMGITGFIAGILYSIGGAVIDTLVTLGWITSDETPGLSFGTVLAFGALIGMPVIFAAFGFFAGVIGAILFNVVAPRIGGIDVNFKQK